MVYGWIVGALAGLDLMVKETIEQQQEEFPRELPCAKGWIRLYRNHNKGFPFGALSGKPEVVRTLPLMMASALAGALAALLGRKDAFWERLGLAVVLGGAVSNIYDRIRRGYVVDYFSIQWKGLKKVVFNLGDIFIFAGGLMVLAAQAVKSLRGK